MRISLKLFLVFISIIQIPIRPFPRVTMTIFNIRENLAGIFHVERVANSIIGYHLLEQIRAINYAISIAAKEQHFLLWNGYVTNKIDKLLAGCWCRFTNFNLCEEMWVANLSDGLEI